MKGIDVEKEGGGGGDKCTGFGGVSVVLVDELHGLLEGLESGFVLFLVCVIFLVLIFIY